jgi:hypothetical protein
MSPRLPTGPACRIIEGQAEEVAMGALPLAKSLVLVKVLIVALAYLGLGCRSTPDKVVVVPSPAPLAELWAEPSDIATRDLFHGVGGAALAPDPRAPFTFVKAKKSGSPGYTVKDARGLAWSVKMGVEAQPEVAVSRLLWAIGFRQPAVYLLPAWTLEGGPDAGPKGMARFRPDRPGWTESGSWPWRQNPFVGTRQLKGLIAFMRIVNNWDLLDRNNELYQLEPPAYGVRRFFVVKDLGASLGRTLTFHQGNKSDVEGFEQQKYIEKVVDGAVHFEDRGRRHHDLYRSVRVEDVRWTSDLLAKLTPKQWQDAFRAAHYDQETAARYVGRIRQKVEEGRRLQ